MSHTPVPWQVQRLVADGQAIRKEGYEIVTENYDVCANILCGAPIRKLEDAEFIVRAVNAHDDLLTALEELLGALDESVWSNDDVASMLRYGAAEKSARAALAKATAQP